MTSKEDMSKLLKIVNLDKAQEMLQESKENITQGRSQAQLLNYEKEQLKSIDKSYWNAMSEEVKLRKELGLL